MRSHAEHLGKLAKTARQILVFHSQPKIRVVIGAIYDPGTNTARVRFTITNGGGTPAKDINGEIAVWRFPRGAQHTIDSSQTIKLAELLPGGASEQELPFSPITIETLNSLDANQVGIQENERKTYIYLVGEIRYSDEIGKPRITGFAREYDPAYGWFTVSGNPGLEYDA